MNTKHTSGPWSTQEGYDRESGLKLTRVLFGASIVAECYGINSAANARLIAAAPDLLEALKRLLPLAEDSTTRPELDLDILDARAAIAKATGETE